MDDPFKFIRILTGIDIFRQFDDDEPFNCNQNQNLSDPTYFVHREVNYLIKVQIFIEYYLSRDQSLAINIT